MDKGRFGAAAVLLAAVFLVAGLWVLRDYGPTFDSQINWAEGKNNLDFILTGKADPELVRQQTHGALIFMLADASSRILSGKTKILDPVSAHHLILPFLSSFFILALFFLARRLKQAEAGFFAALLLVTYPYYLGHAFNNLKDIPLLIFFSLCVLLYADWRTNGRRRSFYGFFVFLGLALCVKVYALLALPVLFIWEILARGALPKRPRVERLDFVYGCAATALLFALFYQPAFWGCPEKLDRIVYWFIDVRRIALNPRPQSNLYSFRQVFYRTPIPVLILAAMGAPEIFRRPRRPFSLLILPWLALPLALPCLPYFYSYQNGMRLFLVFLTPLSLLAALGLQNAARLISDLYEWKRTACASALALLAAVFNLRAAASSHPYEITYFNALIGGLKGAQAEKLPWACDYWLSSYREAGRWLDKYARQDASVWVSYRSGTDQKYNTDLMCYCLSRGDLRVRHWYSFNASAVPGNTYVVFVPFQYNEDIRNFLDHAPDYHPIHRVLRQGGEIFTIYYKGPG